MKKFNFTGQSDILTPSTTCSSGSSYLNYVELQNGCSALGHANTFIPSTLSGCCIDPNSGTVNENRLKENLNMAIDAYISRVDGCACGDTTTQRCRIQPQC